MLVLMGSCDEISKKLRNNYIIGNIVSSKLNLCGLVITSF